MNYCPNICRNHAIHTVKLTFAQWDYRAEMIVEVGGNCSGLDVIRSAVYSAYNKLPDNGDGPEIKLKRPAKDGNGENTLTVAEEDDSDFLEKILISAEIISLEPSN